MDIKRLKEFKEALNFIQKSTASTIRISQELQVWINEINYYEPKLTRGITANVICDTSLKGLVIRECNIGGSHDLVNLEPGDVQLDIEDVVITNVERGNHD